MLIRQKPAWWLPESAVTPESDWLNRRRFVAAMGLGAISLATGCKGTPDDAPSDPLAADPGVKTAHLYPALRSRSFTVERPITDERIAATYNNFYEFTTDKAAVWKHVGGFSVRPWSVTFSGLCARQESIDVDDLIGRMALEERVYRFRCVEAWAMVVPWTGFALAELIAFARPRPEAKYVRFITAHRPAEMPGATAQPWLPWPYHEALRLDEAMNPLAMMATGIYGRPLPRQNGAPMRLVLPWKYGFKGGKSIERIEFVAERPATFWNSLAPAEYDFFGNVDPRVPHPRWSQATERMIGTGERRPTLLYNGYAAQVAALYRGA